MNDPRETLRWVRRMEVVAGIAGLLFAVLLWDEPPARWLLIAMALLSLSPWPGAQAILRKADKNPNVLQTDRDRGVERGRRAARIMVAFVVGLCFVMGLVAGGLGAAVVTALAGAFSGALGAWMFERWARAPERR